MMTESLFSKESIQLFLSLIDNSLQTSCIQFINDCRKSCLRINRTCQQVVIVFFPSISEFVVADILGGSKVLLFGNVIDQEFNVANNWNLGSGLSIVLMIFIFISMAIMNRLASEEGDYMLW